MKSFLAHPLVGVLTFGLLLFACSFVEGQNARYSAPFPSVSSTTATPFLVANVPPNSPLLSVCVSPANQVPCTNYATTYNSAGVACPVGAQDTPDPQPSACQGTGDAQGNIAFWAPPGKYDYTVCIENTVSCFGPYTITLDSYAGPGIAVEVAGTPLSSSTVLDFVNLGNVTFTDLGGGQIEASAPAGTAIEVAGVPLSSASVANFVNTGNVTFSDAGSGQIAASATVTSAPISRPLWSTDSFPAALSASGVSPGGTNGEIWSYPLFLPVGAIIGHITAKISNPGYTGEVSAMAIYSADGSTKLLDSGTFDAGSGVDQTNAITPVTLPAGYYRVAYGQEAAGSGFVWGVVLQNPDLYNLNNAHQLVTSSITYAGGAMPANLGTLTDAVDCANLPGFFFQP